MHKFLLFPQKRRQWSLHRSISTQHSRGFALIAVVTLLVLVALVSVGLLSLASLTLRGGQRSEAHARAQANARLALIMAISQLQRNVGQDRSVTASASILDTNAATAEIDEIKHPNWLGVWDSWGTWLTASYQRESGQNLKIQDTYQPGRAPMFRQWLVSGIDPAQMDAVKNDSPFGSAGSIELVGERSGATTRAGLVPVLGSNNGNGNLAWWTGGENQKANISLNREQVERTIPQAEAARGDAMARRLSEIDGFNQVPRDPSISAKLLTLDQLAVAGADRAKVSQHLHDFTAFSAGLITDVRWGGLRKDLSLLFEQSSLPANFARNATNAISPRPMSSDLVAYGPKIPERPFTGFEQLKAYAQQYRTLDGIANPLSWQGSAPQASPLNERNEAPMKEYWRMPVVAKQYNIFNLQTAENGVDAAGNKVYDCFLSYSPVIQLWNPYNVPLVVPNDQLRAFLIPYKVLPIRFRKYKGAVADGGWIGADQGNSFGRDFTFPIQGESGGTSIRFEPGQFLIFSLKTASAGGVVKDAPLTPGFDPGAVDVSRFRIYTKISPNERPGLAIQAQPWWNRDGTAYWYGGNPGAYCNVLNTNGGASSSGVMIDWFDTASDYAIISPEGSSQLAQWNFSDNEPVPVAAVGAVLKTSEKLTYNSMNWPNDWRCRNWLQSPGWFPFEQMLASYSDAGVLALQRLNCSMQVHMRTLSGMSELAELIPHNGKHGFLGGGSTTGEKITTATVAELPTAPIQSLAGFAGMRLQPGWFNFNPRQSGVEPYQNANDLWQAKITAYRSGVPGIGIGNSFAQPMIPADKVYSYFDISKTTPSSDIGRSSVAPTNSDAFSDFWDHALLVNDGLWDSWFLSSLADARRPTDTSAPSLSQLLNRTFRDLESLPNANYQPMLGRDASAITADLMRQDGYLRSAMYLLNRGAFNVNSTSEDAWFALFSSLRDHPFIYRDANGELREADPPANMAAVSRFQTETATIEATDPHTGTMINGQPTWSGVRYLSKDQLRRLAQECVIQVKKRGPFLNLSDFINRRLAADETGLRGALQAAIDYDDERPDANAINHRYKQNPEDLITSADYGYAPYPFPDAAKGSRFTGVPGYVVQTDLLRPLGNAMTVRDDTFLVRAYGDARDTSGRIVARVWCEATIQRTPEYVDSANTPDVAAVSLDTNGNPTLNAALTPTNRKFGRRLRVVSFRWLNPQSI